MNREFWRGRRVLITGHTGFKGAWLSSLLLDAGATVSGYALAPSTDPNLFSLLELEQRMHSTFGDVRDLKQVEAMLAMAQPEMIFHLAAQALVRASYLRPVETFETNVIGTANVLDAARRSGSARVVIVVTSDKCYRNHERPEPYREDEPLGGNDPYSSSKAAAELVAHSYRVSFPQGPRIATARAGNVIGGGDWAPERLVPDIVSAALRGKEPMLRFPDSVRPWQHVLEPTVGYLRLAESLHGDAHYAQAWNFGPRGGEHATVAQVTQDLLRAMKRPETWRRENAEHPHEAAMLMLDSSKARSELGWRTRLDHHETIDWTARWYASWHEGTPASEVTALQMSEYLLR